MIIITIPSREGYIWWAFAWVWQGCRRGVVCCNLFGFRTRQGRLWTPGDHHDSSWSWFSLFGRLGRWLWSWFLRYNHLVVSVLLLAILLAACLLRAVLVVRLEQLKNLVMMIMMMRRRKITILMVRKRKRKMMMMTMTMTWSPWWIHSSWGRVAVVVGTSGPPGEKHGDYHYDHQHHHFDHYYDHHLDHNHYHDHPHDYNHYFFYFSGHFNSFPLYFPI